MTKKPRKLEHEFHIRRNGLFFSYTSELMEAVSIRLGRSEEWCFEEGVIRNEDEGFPFREKLQPELSVQFHPEKIEQLSQTPKDLTFHVTIEDLALAKRTTVSSHRLDDIVGKAKEIPIDLSSFKDLYFVRGFEITCFIHLSKDAEIREGAWSKSHILLRKVFTVSSKEISGNTFNITWIDFDDDQEKKNVFYYIDWFHSDVSELSGVECFCIYANNNLRSQFKRLENNRHFGHFTLRQLASDIIYNILLTTMEFANIETEPQKGSLHEQMWALLGTQSMDFSELAGRYQNVDILEKRALETEVKKIAQQFYEVGIELRDLKFGGYGPI